MDTVLEVKEAELDAKSRKVRDLLSSYYGNDSSTSSGGGATGAAQETRGTTSSSSSARPKTTRPLDRAEFDSEAYLRRIAARDKLPTLLSQHHQLVHELRGLDAGLQALVYENYNKFISATDTIRTMGDALDSRGVQMMEGLRGTATELKLKVDDTDTRLCRSRARIDELRGVRRMLAKLRHAVALPAKVRVLLDDSGSSSGSGGRGETNTANVDESTKTARAVLAAQYLINALPCVPALMQLPSPLSDTAVELASLRRECEDVLIGKLADSSAEDNAKSDMEGNFDGSVGAALDRHEGRGEGGGSRVDVDVDDICDVLIQLFRGPRHASSSSTPAADPITRTLEMETNSRVVVSKLVAAEMDRAQRNIARASGIAASSESPIDAIGALNSRVLPSLARAIQRWALLFSSILSNSSPSETNALTHSDSADSVVSSLCRDVLAMHLSAVKACLVSCIVNVVSLDTKTASSTKNDKEDESTIATLAMHCECLAMVATDVRRIVRDQGGSLVGVQEGKLGVTLLDMTVSMIDNEIARVLCLLDEARKTYFDAGTILEEARGEQAEDGNDESTRVASTAVYERAVSALDTRISLMLAMLSEYCVLVTSTRASSLMISRWESSFRRHFSKVANALLVSVPGMITTMADLVKKVREDSRGEDAGNGGSSSDLHEAIHRLSKLARSVSSTLADKTLPILSRWTVATTSIEHVPSRLHGIANSLQKEYMIMDSEAEAQRFSDEVARGLREKMRE